MDCTIEDVKELQKRNLALLKKKRDKFNSKYGMHSNDFITPTLAEFENPRDELYNLPNQAYNNTYAGWAALSQSADQDREIKRLCKLLIAARSAKDFACEFIKSAGYVDEFKKYCENRTGRSESNESSQYGVRPFIQ